MSRITSKIQIIRINLNKMYTKQSHIHNHLIIKIHNLQQLKITKIVTYQEIIFNNKFNLR